MAEYATDRVKAKLDDAIDAEETRDELIAARTQELIVKRMADMAPIDIVCGLQSITEAAAGVMRSYVLAGDMNVVGVMARALIHMFIEQDSELMALDWMDRIEREISSWEH